MEDIPELMEVPEVARRLHKSESTIRRMCIKGELKAAKVGKSWLIPVSEVRRLLAPVIMAGGREHNSDAVREAAERNEQPRPARSEPPKGEAPRGDPPAGSGERSARSAVPVRASLQARVFPTDF